MLSCRMLRAGSVLGLLLLLAVTGCTGTSAPVSAKSKPAEEEKKQTVEIKMVEHKFIPGTITTEVGTLLEFKVINAGTTTHEIVIDIPEAEFEEEIEVKKDAEFAVKFRKPGTYKFKCEIPGHAEQGMVGEIVVKGNGQAAPTARAKGPEEEKKQEVKISLAEFKFQPAEIKTQAFTLVEMDVKNAGKEKHEMVVDAKTAEFEIEVEPGKTHSYAMKFREKGAYEYKCELPGHAENGMVGKFTVN